MPTRHGLFFRRGGGEADLVLSDIAMPGSIDGAELMARVMQTYPSIKRIITSANPGSRNIFALGSFLPKHTGWKPRL